MILQLLPFHRDLPCPAFPSAEQTDRPSLSIKMKRSERTKGHRFIELRQGFNELWKCCASFSWRWSLQLHPGASHQMQLAACGHTGRGSGAGSCRGPGDRGWGKIPKSPDHPGSPHCRANPLQPSRCWEGWGGDGGAGGSGGKEQERRQRTETPRPVRGRVRSAPAPRPLPRPRSCPFSTTAPGTTPPARELSVQHHRRGAPTQPQGRGLRREEREGPTPEEIPPDPCPQKYMDP